MHVCNAIVYVYICIYIYVCVCVKKANKIRPQYIYQLYIKQQSEVLPGLYFSSYTL